MMGPAGLDIMVQPSLSQLLPGATCLLGAAGDVLVDYHGHRYLMFKAHEMDDVRWETKLRGRVHDIEMSNV